MNDPVALVTPVTKNYLLQKSRKIFKPKAIAWLDGLVIITEYFFQNQ